MSRPLSAFAVSRAARDGLQARCRECWRDRAWAADVARLAAMNIAWDASRPGREVQRPLRQLPPATYRGAAGLVAP
jgi:hypothetical protein